MDGGISETSTGRPQAMASNKAMPKVSQREEKQKDHTLTKSPLTCCCPKKFTENCKSNSLTNDRHSWNRSSFLYPPGLHHCDPEFSADTELRPRVFDLYTNENSPPSPIELPVVRMLFFWEVLIKAEHHKCY